MASNKLSINGEYLIYTLYGTISALSVKVAGILNYSEAKDLPYSIKVIANNEKVISDKNEEDTEEYLSGLLYYKCVYENSSGEEELVIIWDDIIDWSKTIRKSTDYEYRLTLSIGSDLINDKTTIENAITTYITKTFAGGITPKLVALGTSEESEDQTTKELNETKEELAKAMAVVKSLAKLTQIESLINYFAKDDMQAKIKDISSSLDTMSENIARINAIIR